MARGALPVALFSLLACTQPAPPDAQTTRPATVATAFADPAPLPNRAIEAPRDRAAASLNPSLEPLALPSERPQGFTFGNELPRDTGRDRPFEGVVQGARLRIPFE